MHATHKDANATLTITLPAQLKADAERILMSQGKTPETAIAEFYRSLIAPTPEIKNGSVPMNAAWEGWTTDALKKGCSPIEIRDILIKNNFTLPAIVAAMGHFYPGSVEDTLAQVPPLYQMAPEQYAALANIALTKSTQSNVRRIETDAVQLYEIDDFFTAEECDKLVQLIVTKLRPSTVAFDNGDKYYRTSSSCDLVYFDDPFVREIDTKIAATLGINPSYSEGIQAQRYEIGQEFKQHCDYFEQYTREYGKFASALGNRTWTCMIYLNDTPKGGGTEFVKLGNIFYPKKGRALAWNNLMPDGTPNPNTMHRGMPVEDGEKFIITKWFREKGTGELLTS